MSQPLEFPPALSLLLFEEPTIIIYMVFIYVYVCMYACMYVCMYVHMNVYVSVRNI